MPSLRIPADPMEQLIRTIRGTRVMLDADLARLYGVQTKALNRAVLRNTPRFPVDFAFKLSASEVESLRCQIGTSNRGGRRYAPWAFTEQGISMLSGLLRGPVAIAVNIEIMRAFVRLRRLAISYEDLARKIEKLESRYDEKFGEVFDVLRHLMASPATSTRRIGFRTGPDSNRSGMSGRRRG